MKLVDVYHTPTLGKSNYYLASLRQGETWPEPGTPEVSLQQLYKMDLPKSRMDSTQRPRSNIAGESLGQLVPVGLSVNLTVVYGVLSTAFPPAL